MAQLIPIVEHLAGHPDAIPEIVSWVHAEWGALMPDISYARLITIFEERLTPHKIPQAFIARIEQKIVGTTSMVRHDLSTRMDLSPWLAAVYVMPEYRGHGIGSALVRAVMAEARFMQLNHIYLLTPDRASFYARLGWVAFEKTAYRGENVSLMVYRIGFFDNLCG